MIDILIFHMHLLGALYAFTKFWQNGGIKDGLMVIAIIALLFAIGWGLTGTVAWYIWPQSWNTMYFTNDTLALLLIFIPECFFFRYFVLKEKDQSQNADAHQ